MESRDIGLHLSPSFSYELDPSPRAMCTVQSAKFAIQAKNYVHLHWNPSLHQKMNDKERKTNYPQKIIGCFPLLALLRHRKNRHGSRTSGDNPHSDIVLKELTGDSSVMRPSQIQRICQEIPSRSIGFPWRLQFCSFRDGYSLHNLYRKLSKSKSPVLLIIEDMQGRVFGGLSSSTLKISDQFYGTSECFLFTCYPELRIYKWNGDNFYFVQGREDSLTFGSGSGHAGLWLDSDLNKGRTETCLTYGNPPLVPESDFIVRNVECWTFG